jgi:hypothetical protein
LLSVSSGSSKGGERERERERERTKESVEEEEWCKAALLFARNAPQKHTQKTTDQNEKG